MPKISLNTAAADRSLAVHIGVWLAIFLIFCGVFGAVFPLHLTVGRGLVNTALLALLFYANLRLLRGWAEPLRAWRYWLAAALAWAVITMLRGGINDHFSGGVSLPIPRIDGRNTWLWGSALSNLGVLALSYLFFLNGRWQQAEQRAVVLASERREAELLQLRSHLNPHFLFNVLNNVYALANAKSERTAPTVLQLSQLLRYVTYQSGEPRVNLPAEIAQLRRYIALFQLRGATPLDINLEVTGDPSAWEIEPMLLLPLLENAFKHGDFITSNKAFARFSLRCNEGRLSFQSENSYNPKEGQKDEAGGIGLANIRQRLTLTYGDRGTLTSRTNDGVFYCELLLQKP